MREPEEMGWFAELGADGEPRAVHGVKRLMPEGSVAITEDQAREISAQVRAREPKVEGSPPTARSSSPPVDLQPVLDDIANIKAQILELKQSTAAAIAQVTDGL